jgi:hypothetical protein
VRRTQLYLEEDLWKALHVQAQETGVSVSEVVRRALRERYLGGAAKRQEAMRAVVGMWSDRRDLEDTEAYVRSLRRGKRLEKLRS